MTVYTKKIMSTMLAVSLAAMSLSALDAGSDTAIVLPEVTSTLENTEIRIDPDAIPDFSLVLPLDTIGLPEFKELDIAETQSEFLTFSAGEDAGKDVFMEASLGLGYRSSFNGDFSVYRTTGAVPFSLGFSHETVNGFGSHSASDGYNQSETAISGDTAFTPTDLMAVTATAGYRSGSYGLQENRLVFYSMNHETARLGGNVTYQIIPSVAITGGLDVLYYSQFASVSPLFTDDSDDTGVWFDPVLGFTVSSGNWSLDLTARYATGTTQSRTRADVTFSALWNDTVETAAAAGIVIAANSASQTVYPFSLTVSTVQAVPFSLTVAGGLKSDKTDLPSLQEEYPFVSTGTRPFEESSWFGEIQYQNAVRDYGYVHAGASFEKTAFGNGRLLPDLSNGARSTEGLYALTVKDVTAFNTAVGVAVPFDLIALSGDWNVAWLDRTAITPANVVSAGVSYTAESGRYGAQTDLALALSESAVPYWDVSGFYRLSNAVKVELSGNDLFRFFSDREVCPGYISRGGYVTLSAHVYF